jgi:uncharacterized damage-inducible protein DinB
MTVHRTDPPLVADERTMLTTWLDYQRATLAIKCDRLTDEQLREATVPPSPLSLLGLVRHMAEVERGWFRWLVNGEDVPQIYCGEANPSGDFEVTGADVAEAFARWNEECSRARAIVAAAPSLEITATSPSPELTAIWGSEIFSLRWIMVHMIEEYARHNGHADFLRERIDGKVGD